MTAADSSKGKERLATIGRRDNIAKIPHLKIAEVFRNRTTGWTGKIMTDPQ